MRKWIRSFLLLMFFLAIFAGSIPIVSRLASIEFERLNGLISFLENRVILKLYGEALSQTQIPKQNVNIPDSVKNEETQKHWTERYQDLIVSVIQVIFVVFIGGWYLNRKLKEIEAKHKELESKQLHAQQVQRLVLEKFHLFVEEYYMPLARKSSVLSYFFSDPNILKNEEKRIESLYHLITYYKIQMELSEKKGGMFLQSYIGEWAAVQIENLINKATGAANPAEGKPFSDRGKYSDLVNQIERNEKLTKFDNIIRVGNYSALRENYEKWSNNINAVKELSELFRLYYIILIHECNRPYNAWYEGNNPHRIQQYYFDKLRELLYNVRLEPSISLSEDDLQKYINEIKV